MVEQEDVRHNRMRSAFILFNIEMNGQSSIGLAVSHARNCVGCKMSILH